MTTILESKVDLEQGIVSHVITSQQAIGVGGIGTREYLLNEFM